MVLTKKEVAKIIGIIFSAIVALVAVYFVFGLAWTIFWAGVMALIPIVRPIVKQYM